MKFRRSKKISPFRVTATLKGVSASTRIAGQTYSTKGRSKTAATSEQARQVTKVANRAEIEQSDLEERIEALVFEGELPEGWRQGSGKFTGKAWNGKKWVDDPRPAALDRQAAVKPVAIEGDLPEGWTAGSGKFQGKAWNGKKWVTDPRL